jgi:putative addiction module component (TIGR02574 family)
MYQTLADPKTSCCMDITATLNQIMSLNVEDRILLVQAIWDSIATEQAYPELTDQQKQELDRRITDSQANPDNVMTWQEIRASIRNQE